MIHIAVLRTTFLRVFFGFAALVLAATNAYSIDIQEITTPSGLKAWLVEDYTVPLISVSMEFTGGSTQDPEGQEGLTSVLAAMLDEGAGDLDAAAIKAELEERGIELGFSASKDDVTGGMRILASEKERAFELLHSMLTKPRFEPSSLERIRAAYISSQKRNELDPDAILGKKFRETLFANHPYARDTRGSEETLKAITRENLMAQHKAMFARDNLFLGVVGAINKDDLIAVLEKTFAGLPQKAELKPVEDITPVFGTKEHIQFASPQTQISVAFPGLKRADPDFFAGYIMNHILGGGTFSSWLYEEVREKKGLVYGIGTNLTPLSHSAYLAGGFATKPEQANEALEIVMAQIDRMVSQGPTQEELDAAKKYVFGTYAISNLDTSSKIANVLVGLQSSNLGIDYINNRGKFIDDVTLGDVNRVAKKLLGGKPAVVTIGPGDV